MFKFFQKFNFVIILSLQQMNNMTIIYLFIFFNNICVQYNILQFFLFLILQ